MLVLLAERLEQYARAFNVFGYITLRAVLATMTALVISFVVGPADGTEAHGHEQDDPDEAVGEIAPEQSGDHDRNQDQCAPHRRRAGLDEVGLRAVIAHRLADFHARQPRDHSRADHE